MLLKRFLFCITILFSGAAWAKIEFPPDLDNEDEIHAHFQLIRALIPEITTDKHGLEENFVLRLLKEEQKLIDDLRSNKSYVRAANSRPSRLALIVDKVQKENVVEMGVTPDWSRFLKESGFNARTSAQNAMEELTQILESLEEKSSAGFFSGLAPLLQPTDRRLLAIPNPQERWSQIRERLSAVPLETLRQRFHADRFGIDRGQWDLGDLDEALSGILRLENRLAVALEECNPSAVRQGQTWILADSIENWLPDFEWSEEDTRKIGMLRKSLLKRFGDENAIRTKETVLRRLILREVPPYLAIFRGCVGGDCSTTASWAYSYAPYELSFWIENEQGKKIGYITGAITRVKGKKALYIRDIAGPNLKRGDVHLIVRALYLARSKFKVKEMTLMSESFTAQNHSDWQQVELTNALGTEPETVSQTFFDAEIRRGYFVRANSTSSYDAVRLHTVVRRARLSEKDDEIRVTKIPAQISLANFKNHSNQLAKLLTAALGWEDDRRLKQIMDDQVDWSNILESLRNPNGLPLSEFQRQARQTFYENGLADFDEIVALEPFLLLRGQMNALDFNSDPETARAIAKNIVKWAKSSKDDRWVAGLVEEFAADLDRNVYLAEAFQDLPGRAVSLPLAFEKLLQSGLRLPLLNLSERALIGLMGSDRSHLSRLWALDKLLPQSYRNGLISLSRVPGRAIEGLFSSAVSDYLNSSSSQYSQLAIDVLYRHPALLNNLSYPDQSQVLDAVKSRNIDEISKAKLFVVIVRDNIGYSESRSYWMDDLAAEILRSRKLPKSLREELKVARAQLRETFNCERRLWR